MFYFLINILFKRIYHMIYDLKFKYKFENTLFFGKRVFEPMKYPLRSLQTCRKIAQPIDAYTFYNGIKLLQGDIKSLFVFYFWRSRSWLHPMLYNGGSECLRANFSYLDNFIIHKLISINCFYNFNHFYFMVNRY